MNEFNATSFQPSGVAGSTFGRVTQNGGFYPAAGYLGEDGTVQGKATDAYYSIGFALDMD